LVPRPPIALPPLGELELEVLEYLWRVGEADVIETHAAIGRRRKITLNTVGSTVERLFRKQLLEREKVSHAYRYRAAVARDVFAARRVLDAAGGIKALADAGVLSAFVDLVADGDEAALERLEALIAQKREKAGS
jgi:predicted transcriptional regulator